MSENISADEIISADAAKTVLTQTFSCNFLPEAV